MISRCILQRARNSGRSSGKEVSASFGIGRPHLARSVAGPFTVLHNLSPKHIATGDGFAGSKYDGFLTVAAAQVGQVMLTLPHRSLSPAIKLTAQCHIFESPLQATGERTSFCVFIMYAWDENTKNGERLTCPVPCSLAEVGMIPGIALQLIFAGKTLVPRYTKSTLLISIPSHFLCLFSFLFTPDPVLQSIASLLFWPLICCARAQASLLQVSSLQVSLLHNLCPYLSCLCRWSHLDAVPADHPVF